MANTNIDLTSLDFDTLKTSFKTFLKAQDRFKDYDFEGSNISTLLDILAYNTFINSFNVNMAVSEMFLDSAQLRDSVVSIAKELNYTPRSFRSAQAIVDVIVNPGATDQILLTIPSGTSFTGKYGSNNYTFTTATNVVVPIANGIFSTSLTLYEGVESTDVFSVSAALAPQSFVLSNPTIDTMSLVVVVIEDGGATTLPYTLARSLLDLTNESQVYFMQAVENEKYQIFFGDGVVGRAPKDGAVVIASYRTCSGELPNGILKLVSDGPIGGFSNVQVSTVSSASGGAVSESIESIRYNAPRSYATQERAVTTSDYETLLKVNFPEIKSIAVYGGEETSPPKFGKVFIAAQLADLDGLPDSKKQQYLTFLSNRAPLTITPVFIDPERVYASVVSTVKYDVNSTLMTADDISTFVIDAIQNFNTTDLDDFAVTLLYSKLTASIDAAHDSIVSNETDVFVMKKLNPIPLKIDNYSFSFNVPLIDNYVPETRSVHPTDAIHAMRSNAFIYKGQTVLLEDDGSGNVNFIRSLPDGHHSMFKTGTIDYATGDIVLTNFTLDSYFGDSLRFYATPKKKDIVASQNSLLEIPNDEINITIQAVRV